MPTTVAEIAAVVERLWPGEGAESWDAVGLIAGDLDAPVETILLAVDAVLDTVDEASAEAQNSDAVEDGEDGEDEIAGPISIAVDMDEAPADGEPAPAAAA